MIYKQNVLRNILGMIVVFFLYSCDLPDAGMRSFKFNPDVEVGQTWVRADSLDPFRPIRYDTIKVIDMKGKYSKVVWNGDTTSLETELVSWRRTLLE